MAPSAFSRKEHVIIPARILMRIMTRHAGEVLTAEKALARQKPDRLEPHRYRVVDLRRSRYLPLRRSPMTLAADLNRGLRRIPRSPRLSSSAILRGLRKIRRLGLRSCSPAKMRRKGRPVTDRSQGER